MIESNHRFRNSKLHWYFFKYTSLKLVTKYTALQGTVKWLFSPNGTRINKMINLKTIQFVVKFTLTFIPDNKNNCNCKKYIYIKLLFISYYASKIFYMRLQIKKFSLSSDYGMIFSNNKYTEKTKKICT